MDKNEIKILLVEDDKGDLLLTKKALNNCPQLVNFIMDSAGSLSETIKCLNSDKEYDVILLDMGLPDSNGLETVRRVCEATDIPIVVLTGLGDEEIGLSAIKTGAEDYLTKDMPLNKFLVRTIRYVLERKRVEEELKAAHIRLVRSEKLATVGQLASTVAHELRNPLAVIKNATYLLNMEEKIKTEPDIRENIDIISEETNNADKIISDLLQFSRVKEPTLRVTGINKIVERVLKKVKVPSKVKITTKLHNDLPDIEMDSLQIEQVLCNIVSNGIQAMDYGGEMIIETAIEDNYVIVSVADTGCGISKENLKKVFEPLFSTKAKGTGLGLPVCAMLIDKHYGQINIQSQLDKGTTFIVKLPIDKNTENLEKTSDNPAAESAAAAITKGE
ncbi:MAG: response regulator [Sedimentisphaerales bacterium]|nr:response regulator [Sedimentisphaerales bacterium]